jgi:protein subunit release factor A
MTDDTLMKLLIERTRVLCTVCDQAATVLSEEFEDMVSGPLRSVQQVLAMLPTDDSAPWDGTWRTTDVSVEYFRHETHAPGTPRAVRMTHRPTGMVVETYQKELREDNEQLAQRALYDRVTRRWEAQQRAAGAKSRN